MDFCYFLLCEMQKHEKNDLPNPEKYWPINTYRNALQQQFMRNFSVGYFRRNAFKRRETQNAHAQEDFGANTKLIFLLHLFPLVTTLIIKKF